MSSIRIHHLNCGTMCPLCQRLMNSRQGSWTKPGRLVCHCLLIETPETLIMVDTGMGLQDIAEPGRRLGSVYLPLFRPSLIEDETAIRQVEALGYDPKDIRHIIPTHLDLDHAGGLADFPDAEVHLFRPELDQVLKPTRRDRARFRAAQFDHHPKWIVHEARGEDWFGFAGVRPLPGISAEILIIPLPGHTKGHAGVAIRQGDKWLLHCGDAYYHHSQIEAKPDVPAGLTFFQWAIASLPEARVDNLARLRRLALDHGDEVELFCAHSPVEFERYRDTPAR